MIIHPKKSAQTICEYNAYGHRRLFSKERERINQGTPTTVRERGGCLTWYLVASIVFSILGLVLLLLAGAAIGAVAATGALSGADVPSIPVFAIIVLIVGVIVAIAGFFGAWTWKKWGIYLIGASFVISALGTLLGGNASQAVVGVVIELAILWYVVKDRWTLFEG